MNHSTRRCGNRAFTLIETLFGFAITVIMGIVLWNMFINSATQMEKTTWLSNSQGKVRLAFQRMGDLARSASYPTRITPNTIDRTVDATTKLTVTAGTHRPPATVDLLRFSVNDHERTGFPDATENRAPQPRRDVVIRLNGKILEHRENGNLVNAMVDDVQEIIVENVAVPAEFDGEKGLVKLTVKTTHPNPKFTTTNVFHTGSLAFNVGVNP